MAIVERNEHRLVLEAGGGLNALTLTLDKQAGQAHLERRLLMWKRKPRDLPLAEITDFDVVSIMDGASGAVVRQLVLRTQSGDAIILPEDDRDVDKTTAILREFVGLAG